MTLSQSNMKILSTGVIVAVIIASMGCVIWYDESMNDSEGSTSVYNILARVNSEGSGIYILESDETGTYQQSVTYDDGTTATVNVPTRNDTPYYTVNSDGSYSVSEDNAAAWGGLVAGTPGSTSIQHVQLRSLIESMGLSFVLYEDGTSLSDDTVYYVNTITNTNKVDTSDPTLDIGIIWEPQYTSIVDTLDEYTGLGLTNNFFPGHTCCVIAGYTSYVSSHSDVTIRFLLAYMEAVEWINTAKEDTSSDDYATLVQYGEELTGMSESIVTQALDHITYLYGDELDDGTSDLHLLKKDVSDIVESNSSSLKNSMSDLGFSNSLQFANRLVDDSYLLQASESPSVGTNSATITVAAISGDIHQIALKVAEEQGFFSDYNLNVNIAYESNGAGVAVALQNGEAQFGFLGAPPATITAVNSELITA
jgi:ABC-type nitrate/sulfonate/bicarbonate transport system substrate-binding protein